MKAANPPLFSPTVPGPWGVDSIGKNWYVIHRITLRCKCIGRIGSKGINYFDRAVGEANRRNHKENTDPPTLPAFTKGEWNQDDLYRMDYDEEQAP